MADKLNELQIFIKGIFSHIKEKYGYTDEQALIYLSGYEDCAEEHQQSLEKRDKMLRDTVAELCEAKRLLKAAVEDMRYLESHTVDEEGSCLINEKGELINCKDCPLNNNSKVSEKCCKWNYEDEALKLIGDEENG